MSLLEDFAPPADDISPVQRAVLDGIAALTGEQVACWADQLAVHRWVTARFGRHVAGGGVIWGLEKRGLIERAHVEFRGERRRTYQWNRAGTVYRLTPEGVIEQFAGAA